jgi:metal-dependent amidase/aminoacylase/carboxypeptidase family protein
VVDDASSEGKLRHILPTMGGEDFSFIAAAVPSLFLALGQGEKAWSLMDENGEDFGPLDTSVTVHNHKFVLNEGLLQRGMALHSHLALQRLDFLNKN